MVTVVVRREQEALVSVSPRRLPEVPVTTARVAKAVFARPTLPMRVRDELGELFSDEQFAAAFASRGARDCHQGSWR
jgi:transposase